MDQRQINFVLMCQELMARSSACFGLRDVIPVIRILILLSEFWWNSSRGASLFLPWSIYEYLFWRSFYLFLNGIEFFAVHIFLFKFYFYGKVNAVMPWIEHNIQIIRGRMNRKINKHPSVQQRRFWIPAPIFPI